MAGAEVPNTFGEGIRLVHDDFGAAELTVMAGLDLAAQGHAERLLTVADAQDRHACIENGGIDCGGILIQGRGGAA
ncbi:hypothetical protein D9M69_670420 [compost metagenome]